MYVFLQGHGQEIRDPRIRRIMLPRELACTFLTPRGTPYIAFPLFDSPDYCDFLMGQDTFPAFLHNG